MKRVRTKTEMRRLSELHPDLQRVVIEAAKDLDFLIIDGHRPKDRQDKYFASGASKVEWPDSKHNKVPSEAVDLGPIPYTINRDNKAMYQLIVDAMKKAAKKLGIKIICGADFKSLIDMPHFQTGF